jgi:hypothetical protein
MQKRGRGVGLSQLLSFLVSIMEEGGFTRILTLDSPIIVLDSW